LSKPKKSLVQTPAPETVFSTQPMSARPYRMRELAGTTNERPSSTTWRQVVVVRPAAETVASTMMSEVSALSAAGASTAVAEAPAWASSPPPPPQPARAMATLNQVNLKAVCF
jgi:hypothetical protein